MRMWSELENYINKPSSTYGKCECGIGNKIGNMVEEEKTHQFLMSLNLDAYSTIRTQVLALDCLPHIDTVFDII